MTLYDRLTARQRKAAARAFEVDAEQIASCQSPALPYQEAHYVADRRLRKGEYQVRCPICKRWKWPDVLCALGRRILTP